MQGKRFKDTQLNKNLAKFVVKNKIILLIIACIIAVLAIIGILYAYFTAMEKATTPITSGQASVQLQEDVLLTNIETFRAVSIGNIDAYVRAKMIATVEYFDTTDNTWKIANIPQSDIILTSTSPDWTYSNGYYYYNNILKPGQTSTDCKVEVSNIILPEALKTAQIRTTIKVILEAAQVNHDVWKSIFDISNWV